jgi:hypothetical protein
VRDARDATESGVTGRFVGRARLGTAPWARSSTSRESSDLAVGPGCTSAEPAVPRAPTPADPPAARAPAPAEPVATRASTAGDLRLPPAPASADAARAPAPATGGEPRATPAPTPGGLRLPPAPPPSGRAGAPGPGPGNSRVALASGSRAVVVAPVLAPRDTGAPPVLRRSVPVLVRDDGSPPVRGAAAPESARDVGASRLMLSGPLSALDKPPTKVGAPLPAFAGGLRPAMASAISARIDGEISPRSTTSYACVVVAMFRPPPLACPAS